MAEPLLQLDNVVAGYGSSTVIDGMSLSVGAGESVAILGRNGVGKTTLFATLMGHTRQTGGSMRFDGKPIHDVGTWRRARAGLGLVPQEREIFRSLTVEQNLTVARRGGGDWNLERVYALFPRLAERRRNRGDELSGGEQQMLALGRALMGNPKMLLLDEPLEGLAPVIVEMLLNALNELSQKSAMSLLLVEQHARLALEFAPRTIVLIRGRIAYEGASRDLIDDPARLNSLIGVAES
jgi:branched-chain amino acid transport system ATP-binding protein